MRYSGLLRRLSTLMAAIVLVGVASSLRAQDVVGVPLIAVDLNDEACGENETCLYPGSSFVDVEGEAGRIVGYSFAVDEPLTVTGLGVFDFGLDGLNTEMEVGIFVDGELFPHPGPIVTATIPSGVEAELVGAFRVVPIEPVTIQPPFAHHFAVAYREDSDLFPLIPLPPVLDPETPPALPGFNPILGLPRSNTATLPGGSTDITADQFEQAIFSGVNLGNVSTVSGTMFVPVPEPGQLLTYAVFFLTLGGWRTKR